MSFKTGRCKRGRGKSKIGQMQKGLGEMEDRGRGMIRLQVPRTLR